MNNQLRGYATVNQKVTINCQNSAIVLSVITPEIIRVFQESILHLNDELFTTLIFEHRLKDG